MFDLVAEPADGWVLDRWGGHCARTTGSVCTLSFPSSPGEPVRFVVDVTFVQVPSATSVSVEVAVTGQGSVRAPDAAVDLDCVSSGGTETCTVTYEDVGGTGMLELVAQPAVDWELESWGGGCAGTSGLTCTLSFAAAESVSLSADATFVEMTPGVCTPIEPVADTYIRGGSFADTPFGSSTSLLIKGIASLEFARKVYLAFDVGALPPSYSSVALRLTLDRHATLNPRAVNVYNVIDNDDWDPAALAEGSITWNNAPRNVTTSGIAFTGQGTTAGDGARLVASLVLDNTDPPGTKYEFDITDYVTWALGNDASFSTFADRDADGLITLLLAHDAEVVGDDGPLFWSREATDPCDRPELVAR